MGATIRHQLRQLIDKCDNRLLLEDIKELLESGCKNADWWDDLAEEDKNLVMESEEQYGKGDFIPHDELMKRFEEWKKK